MKHSIELRPEELLGPPARLGRIPLDGESPGFFSWTAELVAVRPGSFDGLAGWFEAHLAPGVAMTNSPLHERINRPQVFLPIGESVAVDAGERVLATVMSRPAERVLAWKVEFPARARSFSHSTWHGMLLSPDDMIRAAPGHVPVVSPEARARGIVLGYCDGRRTAREIEQTVLRDHPGILPSEAEISRFVVEVLAAHTRW
jgi:protein arginine N-methyltransferase 1